MDGRDVAMKAKRSLRISKLWISFLHNTVFFWSTRNLSRLGSKQRDWGGMFVILSNIGKLRRTGI